MAFDGVMIAALVSEFDDKLTGGRISKIIQPEKDELLLTIKGESENFRLLISVNASLPLMALTDENKKAPMTAPAFCMLLRKHINGGHIIGIHQPGLERIVHITVKHLNEMGDVCTKTLIIELMGKHSNIIFCDDKGMIMDSIKHISAAVSSVREVLPGKQYFVAGGTDKKDILVDDVLSSKSSFEGAISEKAGIIGRVLYQSFVGISPVMAQELCCRAGIDGDRPLAVSGAYGFDSKADRDTLLHTDSSTESVWSEIPKEGTDPCGELYKAMCQLLGAVKDRRFQPCMIRDKDTGKPVEFGAFHYEIYNDMKCCDYDSASKLILDYYGDRSRHERIRQKSTDLRHIVTVLLERQTKKLDLQAAQLESTEKREKYKVYGELLHTYGYQAKGGEKSITVPNYYTGEDLTIPLDPQKSAMENAAAYFERYGKLKRTYENLSVLIKETIAGKEHIESILTALDLAENEDDLADIRQELTDAGYMKKKGNDRKKQIRGKPLHFISSDGYDIYVGKNNLQNEEITFSIAKGGDWWFHAKKMPGSHVVLKTNNEEDIPDRAFEEAARLAAHYSRSGGKNKIEIDYIQKKHVKKPAGAVPGFVVYYTNYSMLIDGDISMLRQV